MAAYCCMKGHGPLDSPILLIMVHDVDPLGLQGLDLDAALLPRLLVALFLHVGHHGLVDVHVLPGALAKLLLHIFLAPDHYEITSLLLYLVGALGLCLWHWGCCHPRYR